MPSTRRGMSVLKSFSAWVDLSVPFVKSFNSGGRGQWLLCLKRGAARRSTDKPESRSKYLRCAEWAVIVFLSVLLVNSLQRQSGILTLSYFPTTTRENEPFVVTATVNNMADEPHTYRVSMFVDGVQVFTSESRLDASSTQCFTFTRASPRLGTSLKIYAEVLNLESGERYLDFILIPPAPPELWMSFLSFSSFSISLSSSSAMSTMFTIRYYLDTVGVSLEPQRFGFISSPANVGLSVSMTLIGLLIFLQVTDPSHSRLGGRVIKARSRYGLLVAGLLLIFLGMFFTRIMMILG